MSQQFARKRSSVVQNLLPAFIYWGKLDQPDLAGHLEMSMAETTSLPAPLAEVLRLFKKEVEQRFEGRLSKLILFGSAARGRMSEESDVDLLLVVDPLATDDVRRAADAAVSVMV